MKVKSKTRISLESHTIESGTFFDVEGDSTLICLEDGTRVDLNKPVTHYVERGLMKLCNVHDASAEIDAGELFMKK